eukprot:COSAG06_NODE_52818_length_303_cov_1.333333_2_plen_45_part_01
MQSGWLCERVKLSRKAPLAQSRRDTRWQDRQTPSAAPAPWPWLRG